MEFAKVMFLHVSVILSTGERGGGIPACLATGLGGGGWHPSMSCRFPGPHPGGKLRGLAGGVSRPTPEEEVEGSWLGGVSRPTPLVVYPSMHWGRPSPDGYYCRGYASNWNAFLLFILVILLQSDKFYKKGKKFVNGSWNQWNHFLLWIEWLSIRF